MKTKYQLAAVAVAAAPIFGVVTSGLAARVTALAACPLALMLTCKGDLSAGVFDTSGAFTTLLVNSLTAPIATTDIPAIAFSTPNLAMTLRSSTGTFGISTTGDDDASGIDKKTSPRRTMHSITTPPDADITSEDITVHSNDTITTTGGRQLPASHNRARHVCHYVSRVVASVSHWRKSVRGEPKGASRRVVRALTGIDAFQRCVACLDQLAAVPKSPAKMLLHSPRAMITNGESFQRPASLVRQNLSAHSEFQTQGDSRKQ